MTRYYRNSLSAARLKRVYDLAGKRVREYLDAEIDFVFQRIKSGSRVLELGCGYGRILPRLAAKTSILVGIDNSPESLKFGKEFLRDFPHCHLAAMTAGELGFRDQVFDHVVCIQNGISAFHVDQRNLIMESLRVTIPGGIVFFSSYATEFWEYRLDWFRQQAEEGLVGEIDFEKTGSGKIVCRDGFTANTVDEDGFRTLASGLTAAVEIQKVNDSSLFCVLYPA